MAKVKGMKEAIFKISDGLIGTITDFLLFQLYLSGELFGASTNKDIYLAFERAQESLKDLNYQKFKRAISYLLENDLVKKRTFKKKEKGKRIEVQITQEGKKKIAETTPSYKKVRTWDGKIYFITYDIPEEKKNKRDLLRAYLKRIGCGLLQESVWLSPYNPKEIIREFARENNLGGLILVSSLGKDGSIGEENLKSLINKVYNLRSLNEHYKEFIDKFSGKRGFSEAEISFAYYQILKDDPRLPYELLSNDWLGDRAYKTFITKVKQKFYTKTTRCRL